MIYLDRLLKCKLALLKLKTEDYRHDCRSLLFTSQVCLPFRLIAKPALFNSPKFVVIGKQFLLEDTFSKILGQVKKKAYLGSYLNKLDISIHRMAHTIKR